jgi:hypothetical protein
MTNLTKKLRFYDINKPMLATHKVVHTPTGQDVPVWAFSDAWSASTRVSRILEHDCDCYRCRKNEIKNNLIYAGFTENLDDYLVVEL